MEHLVFGHGRHEHQGNRQVDADRNGMCCLTNLQASITCLIMCVGQLRMAPLQQLLALSQRSSREFLRLTHTPGRLL